MGLKEKILLYNVVRSIGSEKWFQVLKVVQSPLCNRGEIFESVAGAYRFM